MSHALQLKFTIKMVKHKSVKYCMYLKNQTVVNTLVKIQTSMPSSLLLPDLTVLP